MKKTLLPIIAAVVLGIGYIAAGRPDVADLRPQVSENKVVAPESLTVERKEGLAPKCYANVYVIKVVDGDTINVTYDGETQKVRLLDVDTPESVKQGVEPQPYSKEAAKYTSGLVLNKSVRLIFEKGLRDRYGRLLAHVVLKDGSYLNGLLVRNGYARVEFVSPNTAYREYFTKLQEDAVEARTGMWGLSPDRQPFIKNSEGEYVPSYSLEKAS